MLPPAARGELPKREEMYLMATIVSFINFKGGVGKTTLCVEIAASLAGRFGKRVLLVDLDPQTNATLSLMTEPQWEKHSKEHGTLREFFTACYEEEEFALSQVLFDYRKHELGKNLDLLPSHLELLGMDLKLATKFGSDGIGGKVFLKRAIPELSLQYDFILIDCPPNLYLNTQNGLFASDYYVVVALAEYLSTVGMAHIQRSIEDIFGKANQPLESFGTSAVPPPLKGIIFNRIRNLANEITIMQEIRNEYGEMVFNGHVSQSTRIAERAYQRIPIAFSGYAIDRRYEEEIRGVAQEFHDRITGA